MVIRVNQMKWIKCDIIGSVEDYGKLENMIYLNFCKCKLFQMSYELKSIFWLNLVYFLGNYFVFLIVVICIVVVFFKFEQFGENLVIYFLIYLFDGSNFQNEFQNGVFIFQFVERLFGVFENKEFYKV